MKAIISCLLALWIILAPTPLDQLSAEGRYVKVGFIQPDASLQNSHVISQYYTQYLDELSKRTDRGYELISLEPGNAYESLLSEKIDLLLSIEYPTSLADNSPIVFGSTNFGYDVEGFYVAPGETRFNAQDLNTLENARVGLIKSRPANAAFEKFQQEHNLTFSISEYENQEAMLAALKDGEIDMVVDTATNVTPAEKFLLAYARIPVRVVTTRENQPLLLEMSSALQKLSQENPHFEPTLYHLLAEQLDFQLVHYTPEESRFIAQQEPLRVAIYGYAPPFIAYDDRSHTARGIYADLIETLAKNSGLKFTYIHVPDYEQALKLLNTGQADIMLDIYAGSMGHMPFYYTTPLLEVAYSYIGKISHIPSLKDNVSIILPQPVPSVMTYLRQKFPDWHFSENAPSASEAIRLVNDNQYDLALIANSTLDIERPLALYPELTIIPDASINLPMSIVVSPRQPRILQSILNKAITQINPETRTHIIQKHTIATEPGLSLQHLTTFYPLQTGLVCGLILLLLSVTVFQIHHRRAMEKAGTLLEEKNMSLTQTIQELKEANHSKKIYKALAETDALTGVLNKSAIEKAGAEIIASPPADGHCHAMFIIDLDHFKEANDTFGHQRGDDILRRFALSLTHIIRAGDAAGRFGGDEFILVLDNLPRHTIDDVARRITEAAHNLEPAATPPLSASIGIALYPAHGHDYQELLHNADQALYQVKERGRDGWAVAHYQSPHPRN